MRTSRIHDRTLAWTVENGDVEEEVRGLHDIARKDVRTILMNGLSPRPFGSFG